MNDLPTRWRHPLVVFLLFLPCFDVVADDKPLHLHVISGSKEYKSEESLKAFLPWLSKQIEIKTTASWGHDGITKLDGLDNLPEADVLLVFARRMKLDDAQMKLVRAHWNAGKPVIGIRTASHAFSNEDNAIFDRKVLGGNYEGHFKDQVATVHNLSDHPILRGVGSWKSTKMYKAGDLPESTTVIQNGSINNGDDVEPVTWVTTFNKGRMFYTSLGTPDDFADENFKRMLHNAIVWVSERDQP